MSRERVTLNATYFCQNNLTMSGFHLALLRFLERTASNNLHSRQAAAFPVFQHKKNFGVQAEISLFVNTVVSRRQRTK